MDDLISRQAAIAYAISGRTREFEGEKWIRVSEVRESLQIMPSAEPEIIYCKDCKHYNAGFECLIEGYGIERNKNWYCADAERRTDATD